MRISVLQQCLKGCDTTPGAAALPAMKRVAEENLDVCFQMLEQAAADRVTLSGGRYADDIPIDFMSRMGIWFENFSLYAVINECLLWGHTDTVQLFPNWDMYRPASFCSLRTKGAFLLDAACGEGTVTSVTVRSECGGEFRMKNPWRAAVDQQNRTYEGDVIRIHMEKDEKIELSANAESDSTR